MNYAIVYHTKDELEARRALDAVKTALRLRLFPPAFVYKDGWYEIVVPGLPANSVVAQRFSMIAGYAAAGYDEPNPLSAYRQLDSLDDYATVECL